MAILIIDDDTELCDLVGEYLAGEGFEIDAVHDGNGHWRAVGCPACSNTGYAGRTGAYELLLVDDALRDAIHARAGESALRELAVKRGFRSIRDDCERWLADGSTSIEEVARITRD